MGLVNGPKIKVLDHGYVQLVESWGSDEGIIEAARQSTGKGFLGWGPKCETCGADMSNDEACPKPTGTNPLVDSGKGGHMFRAPGDEKLLKFLYDNRHETPFEMAGITIEVQAPIFVFREWHRHRVPFSYNEMSARYTPLPDVNYLPTVERLMIGSDGKNKQSGTVSDAKVLTEEAARSYRRHLMRSYEESEGLYQLALKEGVPKELARVHLPVGRYSRMRASANVRGWLAFLVLRSDRNLAAQWEIRQFANVVGQLVAEVVPRTYELFAGGRR